MVGRQILLGLAGVTAAGFANGGADAVPDSSRFSPGGNVVQDEAVVIVTPERRSQSAAKVPISLNVFNATQIEDAKVGSLIELQKLVPGLVITESSSAHGQPYIRGIGTDIEGSGVESAVAVYVDGVYQSRGISETMRFIDVDRVEVLKGPQGVLYGRNATGGAINIVSRPPSRVGEGEFDVQAGSFGRLAARGTLSGPLSEGVAYARLSFLRDRDGGDTRNLLLNRTTNRHDVRGVRGALELTPRGDFGLVIDARYYRDAFSPTLKPLHPEANPLFTQFHATVIDDPRTVMQDPAMDIGTTHASLSATAKWKLERTQLTSVTAFSKAEYNARAGDLDGTEIPLVRIGSASGVGIPQISHFFSQEFTLVSDDHAALTWTSLVSYQQEKAESRGWNFAYPLLGTSTGATAVVKTDALAVGGQATYALTDRLHVTGGARLGTEQKDLESMRTFVNGVQAGSMADRKRWSALTPKFVIDYAPDRRTLYYVSATKGFKSGGFNTNSLQAGFDPETAVSYEAGFKGAWLDGRLRANLAAFSTHYENMQVAVVFNGGGVLGSTIQNAARAASRGIEANITAKPTPRLDVSLGLQFLRARFQEFVSIDPRYPSQGATDQKGNPLPRAPDVTATLAVQYAWPVQDGRGRLIVRGEDAYRSKIYFSPFKNDNASWGGISVLNAMIAYEPLGRTGWYGSLFVKNLTNRVYAENVFDPQGLGYLAYFAPARTAGIQVGYRY